jgi:hypothetical protein
MKTSDLFKTSAKQLNETIEKTFGRKLNLETFNVEQLEDARNKLRTQIHTARTESSFNETIENDTLTQAQWMHDAIVAELMDRNENIVDNTEVEEEIDQTDDELSNESAPPTAKGERMVKHIKKGYAGDGKLTDKEKSIAYATAWKQHNKEKNESIETGEDMTRLQEGEIQQASAIVTAKTMVDRVGRWIEELSGMENDTLLQLGDSIRDEMSQQQAKSFISTVAPAIQQALQNLKDTRETLATGVRQLTGEEQGAEMLGAEPGMGGEPDLTAEPDMTAEPDTMNAGEGDLAPIDDFAAAEPAVGGAEAAGREQRESIDRSNRLLKVLAG